VADELTIRIDDAAVVAMFARLRGVRDLSPLMADIGEAVLESTQQRFVTSTAPDGSKWKPLADGSGRKPLLKSGTMRDEIAPRSGRDFAELIATRRQARWHQEGTPPYTITAKPGSALHWPGAAHPVPKVEHPGLPARQFMGVSAADVQTIGALGEAFLDGLAQGRQR